MQKKKYILTTLLVLFLSIGINAQNSKDRRESRKKIKALKVAFITEKLDLTQDEAAKFWPIYNQFEKNKSNLYHSKRYKIRKAIDSLGGASNLSENQAKVVADKMIAIEKTYYDIYAAYYQEMRSVISNKKIVKLSFVEREFSKSLFDRYRSQRKSGSQKKHGTQKKETN